MQICVLTELESTYDPENVKCKMLCIGQSLHWAEHEADAFYCYQIATHNSYLETLFF